jgi:hypothetical protein
MEWWTWAGVVGYMIAVVVGVNHWFNRRERRIKRQVVTKIIPINTGQLAQSIGIVGQSSLAAVSSMRNLAALLPPTRQDLSELEVFYSNEAITAYRVQMVIFNYNTNQWEMEMSRYKMGEKMEAHCEGARVSGMSETDISLIPKCTESPGDLCASPVGHGCGFYALKEVHVAWERLRKTEPKDLVLYQMIVLPVQLSGNIIEHENGYRAQYMEINYGWFKKMVADRMAMLRGSPPPFGEANIWYGP